MQGATTLLVEKDLEGFLGARARADEDVGEVGGGDDLGGPDDDARRRGNLLLSVRRQWNVRGAGVATGFRPFGLAWEGVS